jgi:hypothetical protein
MSTEKTLAEVSAGSLILGDYDTSRFNASTTLSIEMPNKQNSTAVVAL